MNLVIKLGASSTANIAANFLIQWYVLVEVGPGAQTDALFAGMTVPQLVLAVVSGSLMHVLVPVLSGMDDTRHRADAWGFLVLVGGMFSLLALPIYASAPWWVPLSVPGFDEATLGLTIELARIQLLGMVFTGMNGVQWAAYHARQRFVWAEFAPMLSSAVAFLVLIWALPRFGVISAAWTYTFRMGFQTLLLAPGLGRPMRPDLKSAVFRQAWRRIRPLLLGTAYFKTDPLVDRFLLSMAGPSSLSLYYLAQQLYSVPTQVLNRVFATPLVPALSILHKARNSEAFRAAYHTRLLQVGAIGAVALLALGLLGRRLLELLVGYGDISVENVRDLWWIMMWLGGMFLGGAAGQICSSSFYARGDTITPTRMSAATYTLYVPAKIVSFYVWGVTGLAITTSIYYLTNLSIQIVLLERRAN